MKLFGILLFALSFTQCKSVKFDQEPPFVVKSSNYSHITGGLPGNSVLNLMIEFSADDTVTFEKVYFQNSITKAVIETKSNKQYIAARYKTSTEKSKYDMVLHENPKKEYGNKPKTEEKFPFELKENEAVITYKIGDKTHFYKLEKIEKAKRVFMPSAKPQ